jgi:hypothetical protein
MVCKMVELYWCRKRRWLRCGNVESGFGSGSGLFGMRACFVLFLFFFFGGGRGAPIDFFCGLSSCFFSYDNLGPRLSSIHGQYFQFLVALLASISPLYFHHFTREREREIRYHMLPYLRADGSIEIILGL